MLIFLLVMLLLLYFLLFLCIINDFECKRYFSSSCGLVLMCVCASVFLFYIRDSLLLLCMIREKNVNGVQVFKKLCTYYALEKSGKHEDNLYQKNCVYICGKKIYQDFSPSFVVVCYVL